MKDVATFPVVEIFGPTIQGEGPLIGAKCVFVRFAHCDSDCVWCDTKYAWDRNDPEYGFEDMTAEEIVNSIHKLDRFTTSVVLTGGNPALQKNMGEILELLPSNVQISVETQGTLYQPWFQECDWIVISPKLSNAKLSNPVTQGVIRELVSTIRGTSPRAHPQIALKIVVFDDDDVDEAFDAFYYAPYAPASDHFFLQVGTLPSDSSEDILDRWRMIVGYVLEPKNARMAQVRVLPQMHAILWGHGRGF